MPEPKRGGGVGEGKKAIWDSLPVSGNLLCLVLAVHVIIRCLVAAATKLLSPFAYTYFVLAEKVWN